MNIFGIKAFHADAAARTGGEVEDLAFVEKTSDADEAAGTVTVELEGEAIVPLRLWVFTAEAGDEHRFETNEPFMGRRTLRFSLP